MKPGADIKAPVQVAEKIFARNGLLVVRSGGAFPPRCVFCNSECEGEPKTVTLVKNPPMSAGVVGGALGGAVGGLIGGLIDHGAGNKAKIVKLRVYVCEAHRHVKKLVIRNVLVIIGISIVAGIIGGKLTQGYRDAAAVPFLIIFGGLIAGVIYAAIMQKRAGFELSLKGVENGAALVKGAGKPFLASLPTESGKRT
jgi:hypothetical protein